MVTWTARRARLAFAVGGLTLAWQAWRRRFLRNLRTAEMSRRARHAVEVLGRAGGAARGVVFAAAGVFLMTAAVNARPGQARGLDATLRAFAATPAGPVLLVVVAAGLVCFGVYSCCEARWRRT